MTCSSTPGRSGSTTRVEGHRLGDRARPHEPGRPALGVDWTQRSNLESKVRLRSSRSCSATRSSCTSTAAASTAWSTASLTRQGRCTSGGLTSTATTGAETPRRLNCRLTAPELQLRLSRSSWKFATAVLSELSQTAVATTSGVAISVGV